jgi:hypothetical protein
MTRKYLFASLLMVAFVLIGSADVSAQIVSTRGKVMMKKADGTTVPVEGATVEAYRTDIKTKAQVTKTNKRGEFDYVSLVAQGTYTIAVSAPNASPTFIVNIRPGNENLVINLSPGDGSKLTEEQLKARPTAVATAANTTAPKTEGGKPQMTAEEAKRLDEENAKKIAEVEAKNRKAEQNNAVFIRALKEGNDAFNSKNYDLAIAKYEEGYTADTEYVGSAPLFLVNKAKALNLRGIAKYNTGVKLTDKAARNTAYEEARKDFEAAAQSAAKSAALLKTATPPTDPNSLKNFENNKYDALFERAEAIRLFMLAKGDPGKAAENKDAFQEYILIEKDAAKKTKAQLTFAEIMFGAGDFDTALPQLKKLIDEDPNNVQATYYMGLGLISVGESDTSKLQEGINYLQSYVDRAPANEQEKIAEAKSIIEELKRKNVTPQKTPKAPAKRRGN